MEPTIGRIVLYQRYDTPGGEHLPEPSPAIITKVWYDPDGRPTGECELFIMNPNGVYFYTCSYSETPTPKPGHWSWPVIEKSS